MSIESNAKALAVSQVTIALRHVSYSVADRTARTLLADISLQVDEGQTLVVLGKSGSGKSTLLRLINRLLVPSEGQVWVKGRITREWDPIRLRRGIGYVIQDAGLFPHFTVAENVGLVPGLEKWEGSRLKNRVKEMLELVGLDPATFADRRPSQLSGGQRQRVGVARALAADPPILLMDEPFGALDPVTRTELQREFAALAKRLGKTIMLVTHDIREALFLASQIALLEAGRLVALEKPAEFLKLPHPEVRAFVSSLGPALEAAV